MTISLTVEEVKDYQTRMLRWGEDRAMFLEKLVRTIQPTDDATELDLSPQVREWTLIHPMPLLISTL